MKVRLMAAALASVALSACGGGGGEGSGGVAVVPGGTPTPTPTSSPSPPPTATPTPSPSYVTFAQLSGDRRFDSACAALNFSAGNPPGPSPATRFGDGLGIGYAAGSDTYTVTGAGLTWVSVPRSSTRPHRQACAATCAPITASRSAS